MANWELKNRILCAKMRFTQEIQGRFHAFFEMDEVLFKSIIRNCIEILEPKNNKLAKRLLVVSATSNDF